MTGAGESRPFAEARAAVLEAIAAACTHVGRDPATVRLIAVTKTVTPDRIREALAAGHREFGENRVQELAAKAAELTEATWHLVGPLQSNKARRAVEAATVIQTVDSVGLAERLDRIVRDVRGLPSEGPVENRRSLAVLIQVNVDDDPAKAGFAPAELANALPRIAGLEALRIEGLMTIGRQHAEAEEARPTFRALAELGRRLRDGEPRLGPDLSMGMSDDYEVAVEEGATIVRVGRALFGERPDHHHDHPAGADRSH